MAIDQEKEELKYSMMAIGELCVMISGILMTHMSFVVSLVKPELTLRRDTACLATVMVIYGSIMYIAPVMKAPS